MVLATDFDGTLVTHQFPFIGNPAPHAVEVIKDLQSKGIKIILLTMRDDEHYYNPVSNKVEPITAMLRLSGCKSLLQEAVDYCESQGIKFWAVNNNPSQSKWTKSRKVHANFFVDDMAVGSPMITLKNGEQCVDWLKVHELILDKLEK